MFRPSYDPAAVLDMNALEHACFPEGVIIPPYTHLGEEHKALWIERIAIVFS